MSNTHSTPRAAKVRVPKWLNDKRASGFWASAKLHTRKFDDEPGVWLIEPEEAWLRRPTALVKVDHLAGPNRRARFETLKALGSADYPVLNEDKEWVILELNRASQRAIKTGSPVDGLSLAQLRTTLAVPSQLYEVVKECYENLLSIGMENNPDDKVFANAGVHLVRRTPRAAVPDKDAFHLAPADG